MIRRGRRAAPGLDGMPYSIWRRTGKAGARTLCRLLRAFADGAQAPQGFNESWSAVLPWGSEPGEAGGGCVQLVENIQPLILKSLRSKTVAAILARGMRPILQREVQRGFVAGRDLVRIVATRMPEECTLLCRVTIAQYFSCATWLLPFVG